MEAYASFCGEWLDMYYKLKGCKVENEWMQLGFVDNQFGPKYAYIIHIYHFG